MKNIKDDAIKVNAKLSSQLIAQIMNCKIDNPDEVMKAYKAYIILTVKLSEETTERFLSSIEYFGSTYIATASVLCDYYSETEVRISNPLKACTTIIDEYADDKGFTGEDRFLIGMFKSARDEVKIACHNFLVQYAYMKTKNMGEVSFLMSKLDPTRG